MDGWMGIQIYRWVQRPSWISTPYRWPLQEIFYFKAFVHESIILLLPPPTCTARTIAILVHVYFAIYDAPRPPCVCHTQYNIGNDNIL